MRTAHSVLLFLCKFSCKSAKDLAQEQKGNDHGGELGNHGSEPYPIKHSAEGEKPRQRAEENNLAEEIVEKGKLGASESFEGGTENDGDRGKGERNSAKAQSHSSYFHHVIACIEKGEKIFGENLVAKGEKGCCYHTENKGETKGFLNSFQIARTIVIGVYGDCSVVHTEYGHEGEALKLEPNAEYRRCGGGEGEKNLVDNEAHHGVQTNGEGAGNADGINVFENFPVGQHF